MEFFEQARVARDKALHCVQPRLNLIGLKRRGVSRAEIAALRSLLADLGRGAFRDSARTRAEGTVSAMEREVLDFILGPSDRSFLAPRPA